MIAPLLAILVVAAMLGFAVWCGRRLRAVGKAEDEYDRRVRALRVERQLWLLTITSSGEDPDDHPRHPCVLVPAAPKKGGKWRSRDGIEVEW